MLHKALSMIGGKTTKVAKWEPRVLVDHDSTGRTISHVATVAPKGSNVQFITTIRNPYKRIVSHYMHYLRREHKTWFKYNALQDDLLAFIDRDHTRQFYPETFRTYNGFVISDILRIENLKDDLSSCDHKYSWGLDDIDALCELKANAGKYSAIHLDRSTREAIKDKYMLDFVEGGYE